MKLRLAEIRDVNGATQDEVAAIAGVSPKTEWNWEAGKTYPNAEAIWKLCEFLCTDPNTLLGWYDEHPEDRPDAPSTRDETALLDNYRASPPEGRSAIATVARLACGQGQEGHGSSSEVVAV